MTKSSHCHPCSHGTADDLFIQYRTEGLAMPYTMNDYRKEVAREVMNQMPLEERLAGLTTEEIKAYLISLEGKTPLARKKKPKTKK